MANFIITINICENVWENIYILPSLSIAWFYLIIRLSSTELNKAVTTMRLSVPQKAK